MNIKYPNIEVNLSDQDGDAFSIIGCVSKALRRNNVPAEEVKSFQEEAMSGDYDDVLQTCMRWVEVS